MSVRTNNNAGQSRNSARLRTSVPLPLWICADWAVLMQAQRLCCSATSKGTAKGCFLISVGNSWGCWRELNHHTLSHHMIRAGGFRTTDSYILDLHTNAVCLSFSGRLCVLVWLLHCWLFGFLFHFWIKMSRRRKLFDQPHFWSVIGLFHSSQPMVNLLQHRVGGVLQIPPSVVFFCSILEQWEE